MRKRKTSITLEEETYKKLKDLSKISGISLARFIEQSVNYVLENNLEKEIFFSKKKKEETQSIEKQEQDKSFKLKL